MRKKKVVPKDILTVENVILNTGINDKWAAIRACGELLVKNGYVTPEYVDEMIEREKSSTVYIGNHVAIPHGLQTSGSNIIESGIAVLQVPAGIAFGDEKAYIFIAIAGKGEDHIDILAKIAMVCSDLGNIEMLRKTTDKNKIVEVLLGSV